MLAQSTNVSSETSWATQSTLAPALFCQNVHAIQHHLNQLEQILNEAPLIVVEHSEPRVQTTASRYKGPEQSWGRLSDNATPHQSALPHLPLRPHCQPSLCLVWRLPPGILPLSLLLQASLQLIRFAFVIYRLLFFFGKLNEYFP